MQEIQLTFTLSKNDEGVYCIRAITFDKNTTDLDSDSTTLKKITNGLNRIFSNEKERNRLYSQDLLNSIDFDSEE